jgi:hypothetical protein
MGRTNLKLVIIRKLNSFFKDEKKLMRKKWRFWWRRTFVFHCICFLFSIFNSIGFGFFLDHCKCHIVTYMDSKIDFCWGLFFDFYSWLILWILNIWIIKCWTTKF